MERFLPAIAIAITLVVGLGFGPAWAEDVDSADTINSRLYQQLSGSPSEGKVETVSGQMYISQENIDASVISDALSAMLDEQQTQGHAVSVRSAPRLNFEIHFKKNSAVLTDESQASLDELAEALDSGFTETNFVLGGHTDQDGDEAVNQPLSQARADSARTYLVEEHSISPDRLVAKGFGAGEPLMKVESNAQDKLYNRRVDLRPLR